MTTSARSAAVRALGPGPAPVLVVGNLVGAACIAINWLQVQSSDDLSADLSAADLGIVGIAIAVAANTLWYVVARGSVTRRRRRLSSRVAGWAKPLAAREAPAVGSSPGSLLSVASEVGRPREPAMRFIAAGV